MYIARVLYPVEVLGPGKRVGIWFCGCPRRCKGCSNPELWEFQERYNTTAETVERLIKNIAKDHRIDGFTITGGDPMYQSEALQDLIRLLLPISEDILVYTGSMIEELPKEYLNRISVLIDGPYVEERNNNCLLRGSDNQRIHILDSAVRTKYEAYLAHEENKIQNFTTSDGIISVGIHKPGFIFEINKLVSQSGITEVNSNG